MHIIANYETIVKNYKKGDQLPPRSLLRLYSFQFCPNSERVRLDLAAKGIEHEVIHVNLYDKPEWFAEKNPLSQVPVIEFDSDNKLLYESLIVADYLNEAFEGKRQLSSNDPYIRARDRIFVDQLSQHLLINQKVIYSNILWRNVEPVFKTIEDLLAKRRTQKFLFGDVLPGLIDYMIWPFIEKIPISIALISDINPKEYLQKELPTISDYTEESKKAITG